MFHLPDRKFSCFFLLTPSLRGAILHQIRIFLNIVQKGGGGQTRPLKSVGVPIPQIYGLIGPPKSA